MSASICDAGSKVLRGSARSKSCSGFSLRESSAARWWFISAALFCGSSCIFAAPAPTLSCETAAFVSSTGISSCGESSTSPCCIAASSGKAIDADPVTSSTDAGSAAKMDASGCVASSTAAKFFTAASPSTASTVSTASAAGSPVLRSACFVCCEAASDAAKGSFSMTSTASARLCFSVLSFASVLSNDGFFAPRSAVVPA